MFVAPYIQSSLRTRVKQSIVFLLLILLQCESFAQDTISAPLSDSVNVLLQGKLSDPTPRVRPYRVAIVASAVPITMAGVFVYLHYAWWSEQRAKFHFSDDVLYAKNLDKAGHFLSSLIVSTAFADLYTFAGIQRKNAVWFGAGTSILCATIVEVRDGLAPFWGFSRFDELANVMGALYPVLQEKVPFFRNFNFKWSWSFTKASYYMTLPENQNSIFLDDYERQNFWFTIDIARLFFPHKDHRKFPYFIDPAIGLSARGLNGHDITNSIPSTGHREWLLGFDINLSKLRFGNSRAEHYVRKYLNFYRLPMPTMRVAPDPKLYIINW